MGEKSGPELKKTYRRDLRYADKLKQAQNTYHRITQKPK